MKTQTVYLSAGINQTKKSLDWNTRIDLIAYAASNHILLYDIQEGRVVGVSNESHGDYINCVHWVKNGNTNDNFLLSTSSDGTSKLWVLEEKEAHWSSDHLTNPLKAIATLTGHTGSVAAGYAISVPGQNDDREADDIFIITTGEDYFIKGWKINTVSGELEDLFSYKLPGRSLALDLLLLPVPPSTQDRHWPLVVYAGDAGHVHIMTSSDGRSYEPSLVLAGHQDWVTSISYTVEGDGGDMLLSSGSKDGMIRLWRISRWPPGGGDPAGEVIQVKVLELRVPEKRRPGAEEQTSLPFFCSLESVLHGHDGLVSGLDWDSLGAPSERRLLLSCARTEDRSVVVWGASQEDEEDEAGSGVWVEKARLGEVGGNREGFFAAKFGPRPDRIVALSHQGGFHSWRLADDAGGGTWLPQPVVSGHFGHVVDVDWDATGRYLLSVSKDQTTRLHAKWVRSREKSAWQEIARPQVHGFDMACVACVAPFGFASAGEEKVVRGFSATKGFVRRLGRISGPRGDDADCVADLPESASVPSLGLSNKGEERKKGDNEEGAKSGDCSGGPPTEDELMLGTLWPEVSKLYGHGNELLSLAASRCGSLLASACRAATELDANIILWTTSDWSEASALRFHRLSVTQLEFSSCDRMLLSVSRDRSWAVFRKGGAGGADFSLKCHSGTLAKKEQHSRIIWSCAWVPQSLKFVTGSRDKTVVVWHPVYGPEGEAVSWERGMVIASKEEVVAVAVARLRPGQGDGAGFLIAIGCVDGSLVTSLVDEAANQVTASSEVEISHRKSIRRLKFRPRDSKDASQDCLTLASCGNDNSVFIYKVFV